MPPFQYHFASSETVKLARGFATALASRFRRLRDFRDGFRRAFAKVPQVPHRDVGVFVIPEIAVSEIPLYAACIDGSVLSI